MVVLRVEVALALTGQWPQVLRPAEAPSAAGWEGRERAAGAAGGRAGHGPKTLRQVPAILGDPTFSPQLSTSCALDQPTRAKNIARRLLSGIQDVLSRAQRCRGGRASQPQGWLGLELPLPPLLARRLELSAPQASAGPRAVVEGADALKMPPQPRSCA